MILSSNRIIKAGSPANMVQVFTLPTVTAQKREKPRVHIPPDFSQKAPKEPMLSEKPEVGPELEPLPILGMKDIQESIKPEEESLLLQEARKKAEEILREAYAKAEEIEEKARKKADILQAEALQQGHAEGYDTGFQKGHEKAYTECQAEMKANIEAFQKDMETALASVEKAKQHALTDYLEELKDCSIAVAEKVMHISLKSSGEVIKKMIVAATEKLKKKEWVKIYIDKYDYDMMVEADADVLQELAHLSDNIKFVVMDQDENGSCIIEMPDEIIDVSVDTQMENIKNILENVRV